MAAELYSVTANSLIIRSGPGTNYKSVGSLSNGEQVSVTSKTTSGWGCIGVGKYVSMQYLKSVNAKDGVYPSYNPTANLSNRPIYLLQTDSRWKNVKYTSSNNSSQTIGSSGCGPTSMSMIINEWFDKSYTPVTACAYSVSAGYRTASNGTAWGFFKAMAVKYGLKFTQTSYSATAKKFLDENPGSLVICAMRKGNWTTGGHFILMYKCDGTYVYINDPASTRSNVQKNTFALLKSQCSQYFCFAKPVSSKEKLTWADRTETLSTELTFIISASSAFVRSAPTTSEGNNVVGFSFTEGAIVRATKKCGDWYYITGKDSSGKNNSGWCPATYLADANIDNVSSDIAVVCKAAIQYLVNIGFLTSPDYWYDHVFDMDYAANLIISIVNAFDSKGIKSNKNNTKITDVNKAVSILVDNEIISSPNYWSANYGKVQYCKDLICRAAEWLS